MDALLDAAPCGFLTFADDGTLIEVNLTLRKMLGYEADTLKGKPLDLLFSVAGRIFFQTHFFPLLKLQGELQEIYLSLRCQDGKDLAVLINAIRRQRNGQAVTDCVLMPVRQRSLYEDEILRAKMAAEEVSRVERELNDALEHRIQIRTVELTQSREQLRQFSGQLRDILEEERARISRQVHDELGQMLTVLKMQLSTLGRRLRPDQHDLLDKTQAMSAYIDESIQVVRRIAADLRPSILDDLGLIAALEWQLKQFESLTSIRSRLSTNLSHLALDRHIATGLYRITQESLTNVMRHAQATEVEVNLTSQLESLELTIRDNGVGITESELNASKSLGVFGLRERAQLLGGTLEIHGQPGNGTTVVVRISTEPAG